MPGLTLGVTYANPSYDSGLQGNTEYDTSSYHGSLLDTESYDQPDNTWSTLYQYDAVTDSQRVTWDMKNDDSYCTCPDSVGEYSNHGWDRQTHSDHQEDYHYLAESGSWASGSTWAHGATGLSSSALSALANAVLVNQDSTTAVSLSGPTRTTSAVARSYWEDSGSDHLQSSRVVTAGGDTETNDGSDNQWVYDQTTGERAAPRDCP